MDSWLLDEFRKHFVEILGGAENAQVWHEHDRDVIHIKFLGPGVKGELEISGPLIERYSDYPTIEAP